MAYRDLETGRARDRERFSKRTAERRAKGLCPRCGLTPPAPGLCIHSNSAIAAVENRHRSGNRPQARCRTGRQRLYP